MMTKEQAIEELEGMLYYWKHIKFYNNTDEQEAVEFAINYMSEH